MPDDEPAAPPPPASDSTDPGEGWVLPAEAERPAGASAARKPGRWRWWAGAAALVLAGAVGGGGIAYAITSDSGGHGRPAFFAGPPRGQPAPPAGVARNGAGLRGEQYGGGTVTAVGRSAFTVKSVGGTTAYRVTSTTQIVRNGVAAALSDVRVGDPVLVHVLPGGTEPLAAERIFAGTLPPASPDEGSPDEGSPDH